MVIDFHAHCFPDDLAPRAVAALSECAGIPARLDGTIEDIKRSMKRSGIDATVVLSIATKPSQTERISRWSAMIQQKDIIAFGSIHPDSDQWKDELNLIKELGLKGIKFHPEYQTFFVDEERMYPIYQKAFELGLIIVFHAGVDIGMPKPYHCTPDRLSKLIDDFPGGKMVAAHMGGFSYWNEVEEYLVGKDIYIDTSYSIGIMDNGQAKRIIKNHGYKKILFATDSPWMDQYEEIQKIKSFGLGVEVQEAILGENARVLLAI